MPHHAPLGRQAPSRVRTASSSRAKPRYDGYARSASDTLPVSFFRYFEAGWWGVSGAWQGQRFPRVSAGASKRRVTLPLTSMAVRAGQGQRPLQRNRTAPSRARTASDTGLVIITDTQEGKEIVRLNSVRCCLDVLVSAVRGDDDADGVARCFDVVLPFAAFEVSDGLSTDSFHRVPSEFTPPTFLILSCAFDLSILFMQRMRPWLGMLVSPNSSGQRTSLDHSRGLGGHQTG